ncbi:MAG: 50S ribosomal protein L25 [Acidobacteriota bacterium]|jgi:large subunit ribosomal protein L25|nr:50S ribosomal protein L25 [Acidobacteriota bacterium]
MPTVIEAQTRTPEGKNANRRLRKAGKIPAVLYGPGKQPTVLALDPDVIKDILHSEAGQNTIFTVNIEGAGQSNAMVKDYQLDPIKGGLIHADLLEIDMNRSLTVEVSIEIVGEPQGVKLDGGTLDFVTRAIEVECLPADIPDSVKLDVGALKINDYIRVKNLQLGDKVKVLTEPENVIVTVAPPQKEEATGDAAAAEPEVIKKGKADEAAAEDKAKK